MEGRSSPGKGIVFVKEEKQEDVNKDFKKREKKGREKDEVAKRRRRESEKKRRGRALK